LGKEDLLEKLKGKKKWSMNKQVSELVSTVSVG
jgi:hypothetical protein